MHFVAYEQNFRIVGAARRRLLALGGGRIALHAELFPFYSTACSTVYSTVFGRGVPARINAAIGFWRLAAGVPAREVALKFFSLGIEVHPFAVELYSFAFEVYPFACEVHPFVAEVHPAV